MQPRKIITLSRDAVLWEAGDAAHDVAVLRSGKLGARAGGSLVGIVLPQMVIGESALFAESGRPAEARTATVFAIEDGTEVVEYPAAQVREATEDEGGDLVRQIFSNLAGQICRNLLMVVAAKRGYPFIDDPLLSLVKGLVRDLDHQPPLRSWDNLMITLRFLSDLRDVSDRLVTDLGPGPGERAEMVVNAAQMLSQLSEGDDIHGLIETFLTAEKEKNEWWAREPRR